MHSGNTIICIKLSSTDHKYQQNLHKCIILLISKLQHHTSQQPGLCGYERKSIRTHNYLQVFWRQQAFRCVRTQARYNVIVKVNVVGRQRRRPSIDVAILQSAHGYGKQMAVVQVKDTYNINKKKKYLLCAQRIF